MNIVYINFFAGSKLLGMEFRTYYLSKHWVKMGNNVSILASSYAHTRITQPTVKKNLDKEIIDGVDYYWIKSRSYKGNGLNRVLSHVTFICKLVLYSTRLSRELKPDVVIASSTFLLDFYPAYLLSKLTGAKLVHEIHDLIPLSLIEIFKYSRYNLFILMLSITERIIYKKSDKIVSILPNAYLHLKKFGVSEDKYTAIPNGLDLTEWHDSNLPLPAKLDSSIREYRKNGFFIVGYAGYIAPQNSLDTLIDTAELLKEEKIVFFIVGDGPNREDLITVVDDKKLTNIIFHGLIPKKAIPSFLNQMDALFLAFKDLELYKYGVNTNKLYDYMMSAKPVIQVQTAGMI